MTEAQTKLYFREWNAVRAKLRKQGVPSHECDERRHALHAEALGARKSSKDFTNADLDRVLAVFRAITQPANLDAQLDAQGQARKRKLFVLDRLLANLSRPRAYAEGIARQMNLSTADLETMPDAELRKILAALTRQTKRPKKAAPAPAGDDEGDPF